jgi:5-enolpyruvylshikimate-3-phosphate synthase
LVAKGETTIEHAHVAQVSYPAFWQTLLSVTSKEPT